MEKAHILIVGILCEDAAVLGWTVLNVTIAEAEFLSNIFSDFPRPSLFA